MTLTVHTAGKVSPGEVLRRRWCHRFLVSDYYVRLGAVDGGELVAT